VDNSLLIILIFLSLGLGAGITFIFYSPVSVPVDRQSIFIDSESPEIAGEDNIQVEIRGAGIANPGIYHLSSDSQVADLISQAGGLRKGAYTETVPFDRQLYSGLKITLPTRKILAEIKQGSRPLTGDNLIPFHNFKEDFADPGLININHASHYALQELMGIGPVLAENIIRYREEEGPFQNIEELKNVPGIGQATFKIIFEQITVR